MSHWRQVIHIIVIHIISLYTHSLATGYVPKEYTYKVLNSDWGARYIYWHVNPLQRCFKWAHKCPLSSGGIYIVRTPRTWCTWATHSQLIKGRRCLSNPINKEHFWVILPQIKEIRVLRGTYSEHIWLMHTAWLQSKKDAWVIQLIPPHQRTLLSNPPPHQRSEEDPPRTQLSNSRTALCGPSPEMQTKQEKQKWQYNKILTQSI